MRLLIFSPRNGVSCALCGSIYWGRPGRWASLSLKQLENTTCFLSFFFAPLPPYFRTGWQSHCNDFPFYISFPQAKTSVLFCSKIHWIGQCAFYFNTYHKCLILKDLKLTVKPVTVWYYCPAPTVFLRFFKNIQICSVPFFPCSFPSCIATL